MTFGPASKCTDILAKANKVSFELNNRYFKIKSITIIEITAVHFFNTNSILDFDATAKRLVIF